MWSPSVGTSMVAGLYEVSDVGVAYRNRGIRLAPAVCRHAQRIQS